MTTYKAGKLAVIGYAGVFPQADSPEALWDLLCAGQDAFTEIPADRWPVVDFYSEDRFARNKSSSKWMAAIDLPALKQSFWANFPVAEHATVDPQQLLLLRETERALAHAGLSAEALVGRRVSVSVGCMDVDNLHSQCMSDLPVGPGTVFGNYQALLANRISQHFGFTGESKAINTACSASFMALSDARSQLTASRADYAIVAAANLNLHPLKYYAFSKAGMLSRTGRCRPFDITADGYVPGDCVAALCVTTLERAVKERHKIHAVIDGMAGNHNGNRSLSPTAPSVTAQIELLEAALEDAQALAQDVSYIEAHGTGTSLGDPIEIEALAHVYGQHPCHVGSIKGVIGHTEAAAGLAAMIKTMLMFRFQTIPGNHWITALSPLVAERLDHIQVTQQGLEWNAKPKRIVGISSFGSGGANGHIILSEWCPETGETAPPLKDGFYLCQDYCPPAHQIMQWAADKTWQRSAQEDRVYRTAFQVHQERLELLAPLSDTPRLAASNALRDIQRFNLLCSPLVILADAACRVTDVSELLSALPNGSFYVTSSGLSAKLPTTFLQELSCLRSLLAGLDREWLERAGQLEHHQFTFKLLVAKWRKYLPGDLNDVAERWVYAMAYSDLYDKWSLVPKTIPACLGVIKRLLSANMLKDREISEWFHSGKPLINPILSTIGRALTSGEVLPVDMFECKSTGEIVHCTWPEDDRAVGFQAEGETFDMLIVRSWLNKQHMVRTERENNLSPQTYFSE
ncbi:beta-ketoacyl [acyl carrier protein] synthase domain-containing protein [Serratia rhizosphaerae]|uniref:beta-ketoacyl [acyl carrier protein] synthase domain-containing protein n=1 Tax=Serratia sp. Tan611 TaxID=2773264 RepID=UPI0019331354|nr:polyketide synthase [Serratia sp. Tan611]CAE1147801.1 PKS_KS domain-containing protein [Serratia sp. Tan611]